MPAQQPVQQMPAQQPVNDENKFSTFMQIFMAQMNTQDANGQPLIDADYVTAIVNEISTAFNTQISAITDISSNPAMIDYAVQLFQRDGKWAQ